VRLLLHLTCKRVKGVRNGSTLVRFSGASVVKSWPVFSTTENTEQLLQVTSLHLFSYPSRNTPAIPLRHSAIPCVTLRLFWVQL